MSEQVIRLTCKRCGTWIKDISTSDHVGLRAGYKCTCGSDDIGAKLAYNKDAYTQTEVDYVRKD